MRSARDPLRCWDGRVDTVPVDSKGEFWATGRLSLSFSSGAGICGSEE